MKKIVGVVFACASFFLLNLSAVSAASAGLKFSTNTLSVTKGEQRSVGLVLVPSGNSVVGVDLILHFDPQHLKVIDIIDKKVLSAMPYKNIDNSQGIVKAALSNNYGKYTTEEAVFAELVIEARETASTNISFDYALGKTTDTNVAVLGGNDVLGKVDNLTVTISSANSSPGQTTNSTTSTSETTPRETLAEAGDVDSVLAESATKDALDTGLVNAEFAKEKTNSGNNSGLVGQVLGVAESDSGFIKWWMYALWLFVCGLVAGVSGYAFTRRVFMREAE